VTRDARDIVDVLGAEVKRVGYTETARRTGIDRCSLHRAFRSKSSMPAFSTIALVAMAVGVKLEARRI
jgi:probable addiction module antidote protein